MKVGLYLAGDRNELRLYMSLDLDMDRHWWNNQSTQNASTESTIFQIISRKIPLQWAFCLEHARLEPHAAGWTTSEWSRYLHTALRELLQFEAPDHIPTLLGLTLQMDENRASHTRVHATRLNDSQFQRLTAAAYRLSHLLEGRSLLSGELESMLQELDPSIEKEWKSVAQLAYLQGTIRWSGAIAAKVPARHKLVSGKRSKVEHRCNRCGSVATGVPCGACGTVDCARCELCRLLGRSRSCELLVQGASPSKRVAATVGLPMTPAQIQIRLEAWKLSPAQRVAASQALCFLEAKPEDIVSPQVLRPLRPPAWLEPLARTWRQWQSMRSPKTDLDTSGYAADDPCSRFLIWAVTGAGKTEMLFPLIEHALSRGGRVLVATPRRDVVLELAPRLRKAFPQETIVALYGGSEERWRRGSLTLATTHQLLRFADAFDLVVIDELDAFPFHGDPMLAYAAERCRAASGRTIYLSATPPSELQRLVRQGRLACAKVPVRYHRYPLPVPELLPMPSLKECLRKNKLPGRLLQKWQASLKRGAQVFIFVPKIAFAEPLAALLRRNFPGIAIGATSSQDIERGDKVVSFRTVDLRMLVTTTILERGVTVPRSDVYILDADSLLFDEASLVQMAGRAGRSADDPAGNVVFAAIQKTRAQVGAYRQIRRMNRLARPYLYSNKVDTREKGGQR